MTACQANAAGRIEAPKQELNVEEHMAIARNKSLEGVAKTLLVIAIVGAINWGLVGFFNWNLVDAIFGGGAKEVTSTVSRVIYALIGLCGVAAAFLLPRMREQAPVLGERSSGGRVEVHR